MHKRGARPVPFYLVQKRLVFSDLGERGSHNLGRPMASGSICYKSIPTPPRHSLMGMLIDRPWT